MNGHGPAGAGGRQGRLVIGLVTYVLFFGQREFSRRIFKASDLCAFDPRFIFLVGQRQTKKNQKEAALWATWENNPHRCPFLGWCFRR